MISHLQFADDTIFFVDAEEPSFKNLLILLGLFSSVSGLNINISQKYSFGDGSRR